MGKERDRYLKAMFVTGACDAYVDMGMHEKDAEAVAEEMLKAAQWLPEMEHLVYDRRPVQDFPDHGRRSADDDTWWSRNKGWALPLALSSAAFMIGADAGRNGRPDRGYVANAGSRIWGKVKALLGIPDNPIWRRLVHTDSD